METRPQESTEETIWDIVFVSTEIFWRDFTFGILLCCAQRPRDVTDRKKFRQIAFERRAVFDANRDFGRFTVQGRFQRPLYSHATYNLHVYTSRHLRFFSGRDVRRLNCASANAKDVRASGDVSITIRHRGCCNFFHANYCTRHSCRTLLK